MSEPTAGEAPFGTRTVEAAITAAPEVPGIGTWYLNANYLGGSNNFLLTATITGSPSPGVYQGTLINEQGTVEILDNITWDAPGCRLEFRRNGQGFWQWYNGTVVEGVLVGRFSHDTTSSQKPAQLASFSYHVTGWNSAILDRDIVPRFYDLVINTNSLARLRIDRLPTGQFVGRLKVYATQTGQASDEQPEYDLEVTQWDGTHLSFTRHNPNWTEVYTGVANGRGISGTFTRTGMQGTGSWHGIRAGVLSYGLVGKTPEERVAWQARTRHALYHLMMAGNPLPVTRSVDQQAIPVSDSPGGGHRDDNPQVWPQNYQATELHFHYTLPNPYGGPTIARQSHGYLAVPNSPPPGGKYRAVLALNGHGGSAWQVMNPDAGGIYWYGNAFARRGYVVLALDMSHRPAEDSKPLYEDFSNAGDDPGHGNGPHPAIKAPGFDSDWAEDGERAWDAMRALDYLLSLPDINTSAVLVTGLSMGGEITTIVAALDPRLTGSIPAGFSPDLDVMLHHDNHPCWRWMHANIREYIDVSDLHALIAPRPLIVQTGRQDKTYSSLSTPFSADKQVARRSRLAYGSEARKFVHYLHYDFHNYHVGDVDPQNPNAERGVHVPTIIEPQAPFSLTWQMDSTTTVVEPTLFDYLDFLLQFNSGTMLHTVQDALNGSLGGWSRLGDAAGLGSIAVISGINGGQEIFAVDTGAGFVWTNWQNGPNGSFQGWVIVGNKTGFRQVTAGRNADGRLEVFAIDAQGVPWHTAQPTPSSGFPDWSQLGDAGGVGQMMVISGVNGGLEIFAVDTGAGFVWTNWQNGPNGSFQGWVIVGNKTGFRQVTAGRNADGRLEVFALDTAGRAWYTAQPTPSSGFPDWSQLGGGVGLGQIAVISTHSASLEVFATDTAAGLAWTIFQDGPNGIWEGWVRVADGVGLRKIAVGKNVDGRLEVIALDTAGRAWYTAQLTPSSGFPNWSRLGDAAGLDEVAVGQNADGRLEVFAVLR